MARIDRIIVRQQGMPPRKPRMRTIHAKGSYRLRVLSEVPPHSPAGEWWRTRFADLVERRAERRAAADRYDRAMLARMHAERNGGAS